MPLIFAAPEGLHKRHVDAEEKEKSETAVTTKIKLENLLRFCSRMNEAQSLVEHLYLRLCDIEKQLKTMTIVTIGPWRTYVHNFMCKYDDKHTMT